jgi:hypothetical protein
MAARRKAALRVISSPAGRRGALAETFAGALNDFALLGFAGFETGLRFFVFFVIRHSSLS